MTNEDLKNYEGKQVAIEYVANTSTLHPMYQKLQKAVGCVEVSKKGTATVIHDDSIAKTLLAFADEITKITIL